MKYCQKCGKEIMDEAVVCPHCGCETGTKPKDGADVGLCVLSFLFPIFGLIYWPVNYSKTPRKAQLCGAWALLSIGISIFAMIFLSY